MADIEFYEDGYEDQQDDSLEDGGLGLDDGDMECDDEELTPIQKMERCLDSQNENIFSRHMVARSVVDTIRTVVDQDETEAILTIVAKLSEDPEPSVRAELMEQIPQLASHCHEVQAIIPGAIRNTLLPIVTRYLTDSHNQVRKTSQAALLVLLEQDLIEAGDFEEQICPVILDLSTPDSIDDFRTEAVALMSKIAPLVGQVMTVKHLMPRFADMCTDPLFHVRKVCAANFGDMCTVIGSENVSEDLLHRFQYLCEDGVWGVRKACADCFTQVSASSSLDTRREDLAYLFTNLICDQSRWVRMAAFQNLGGFISTFADPSNTGLSLQSEKNGEENDLKIILDKSLSRLSGTDVPAGSGDNKEGKTSSSYTHVEAMDLEDNPVYDQELEKALVHESEESIEERRAMQYNCSNSSDNSKGNDSCLKSTSPDPCSNCDTKCKQTPDNGASLTVDQSLSDNSLLAATSPVNVIVADSVSHEDINVTMDSSSSVGSSNSQQIHLDNISNFQDLHYWREPLPDIDLNLDTVNGKPSSHKMKSTEIDVKVVSDEDEIAKVVESLHIREGTESVAVHQASVSTVSEEQSEETVAHIGSTHVIGQHVSESTMAVVDGIAQNVGAPPDVATNENNDESDTEDEDEGNLFDNPHTSRQDVIPQALLDHYLSMTDPSRAQTVDADIARHCAYNLPAVAYTLGRKHWPCLRELYETLAADMQWKVRRTLAFSIHQLAVILGEDITNRDLVPIFNGFLKDLDEVRIGVLKHMSDFLLLLPPESRKEYLQRVKLFLNMDNLRNWRFREDLGLQLIQMVEIYETPDIVEHLLPVAMALAEDKVCEVRAVANKVMAAMCKKFVEHNDDAIMLAFINDIIERFALDARWNRRQIFVNVSNSLMGDGSLPPERVARELLPSMLALGTDRIPNVRICLARCLAKHVVESEFYTSGSNPHHKELLQTIQSLQSDSDRDVRFYINRHAVETLTRDTIPV